MGLKLITPAGVGSPSTPAEPLTLAESKAHLRAYTTVTAEDDLITALITAARVYAESFTNRVLLTQTWELVLDAFPAGILELPKPPLVSVESVLYIDVAGVERTLAPALYKVDTVTDPGRMAPAYGQSWPATRSEPNAVTIGFVAGFGVEAAAVPQPIRQAMLLMIGHLYANREAVQAEGDFYKLPLGVEALLQPYRCLRWD